MPERKKVIRLVRSFPKVFSSSAKSKAKGISAMIAKKPLTSFFLSLGLLLFLIIISNFIFRPKAEVTNKEKPVKEVQTYKIGSVPKLNFAAQIEKSGVVKILAQTSGIVNSINVSEGQEIVKGANLLNIASNYAGGNAAGIQAEIAQKQYDTVSQTFDIQKDIIAKQRDLTNKVRDNADKLRDISSKSLDDTNNLVNLNQDILNSIDQNLTNLQNSNTGGVNDQTILQTKELKSQFLSAQLQIQTGLRNMQYTTDANNNPQQIANVQKDITLRQLDMQEKSLQLSRDVAKLQLSLAYINTSFFHPTAPFDGKIDRVYVKVAQQVNSGNALVAISGNSQTLTAVVKVPETIAKKISKQEKSVLAINGDKIEVIPSYISNDATDGTLYSVIYNLTSFVSSKLTDGSFVDIQIPVGFPDTGVAIPYVPLDAIFQTQQEAIVYVVDGRKAKAKTITVGNVAGRYVEVTSGLADGDQIILNRNVLDGDQIKVI